MVDLRKELDQCYLTDPTTGVENVLWFIVDEFPYLHDYLLEPSLVDSALYDIYDEYANENKLTLESDILAYIGELREAEFKMYFNAAGVCDVYDYDTWLNIGVSVHWYNMVQTLTASHKQVVLYAALLHLVNNRGLTTIEDSWYEKLKSGLLEAADEFRDEHTLKGTWDYTDKLLRDNA